MIQLLRSRPLIWAGALALCGQAVAAQTPLARQISALTSEPAVARDHWGIMVTMLDGKPIYALNGAQLFQPASNAKLFTTAAAMALLGTKQRFTTRVEYTCPDEQGKTIAGNIVIVGSGDANLNGEDFPYTGKNTSKDASLRHLASFADQIAASGVRR